jgi:hypothetical protein
MSVLLICDGGRLQPERPSRLICTVSIKTRFPPALLLGDHSVSDPPDPISNSAVKPDRADGTNAQALEE